QAREVAAAVRAALSGEAVAVFALEYPCHAPDEQRWFEVSVTRFDDGDQAFAVLSHRNVTERKRADAKVASLNATLEARVHERTHALEAANAALRSSEERFRSVFENTSVGAIVVERDGRIVQVNREFAAITGREVGTLMDSRYSDIVHPDDLAQLLALRQQLLDGQIPGYVQEARIVRPGGAIAWVHISVGAVRNSAGRVAQTVALVHDVSGHKRAVYERDQFFELSADMFVIVDLGGVIHRTNASFERILGFGADELNRMHYLDLVHADDRDPMRLELARLSAGLPADLVDVRMRDKAGRYHDVRWSAAVWNERGLVLAVGRDITTRREAERALRAREAMLARAEQMALMGSFHVDPGQGAVQCSPGLLQLAGLAPQDAPDQLDAVIRLFEPQDQPALRAAIAGAES
ncbi:MAG: PAS domain S-box protein, partial [Rhodoferax sp.]|nr:PAS domain S-box protein [Rhodoferax sp.]